MPTVTYHQRALFKLIVAMLALACIAGAHASDEIIAREGNWQATRGVDWTGVPLCVMEPVNSTPGQAIHIKWFAGDTMMTIHLVKTSWNIPQGTTMRVELGFDRNGFAAADGAVGAPIPSKHARAFAGSYIQFKIADPKLLADFALNFENALKMWLTFPAGTEQPWVVDMTGSRTIANAFFNCAQTLALPPSFTPGPQPYSSAPTQPHGAAPTQPFGTPPTVPNRTPASPQRRDNTI
jgi:hypothetical protein